MGLWLDMGQKKEIIANVKRDSDSNGYFFVMVVLSCTVATYGLLSNSTAVVIGAMLIAPLMGPILGGALGIAANSNPLLRQAAKAEAAGCMVAIVLSALLTLILPQAELTGEVMARTNPTILDLVVALASGMAGTYSICVKPQSAALPGVAIATALMPPLCAVGIGLAKQNFAVVSGALLLFLANMVAINVAAIAMFELAGFSQLSDDRETLAAKSKKRIVYPVLLLFLISIPLAFIMYKTYNRANVEKTIKSSLAESLEVIAPHSTLVSMSFSEKGQKLQVDTAFRTTKMITPENIRQIENVLELRLGKAVAVDADVLFVQKVNNQKKEDTFNELLPKIKEKEVVEVIRSTTPEDMVETVLAEKFSLLPDVKLEDYTLTYSRKNGTYIVTVEVSGSTETLKTARLENTLQHVFEEQLKRRVTVRFVTTTPLNVLPSKQ